MKFLVLSYGRWYLRPNLQIDLKKTMGAKCAKKIWDTMGVCQIASGGIMAQHSKFR